MSVSSDNAARGDNDRHRNVPLFVLFGRPGAGKTTVAHAVVELLHNTDSVCLDVPATTIDDHSATTTTNKWRLIHADLDVCIPEWMKDNFRKGVYPDHGQRVRFADDACDHVDGLIRDATTTTSSTSETARIVVLVSFSFVNTDLRDRVRERYNNEDNESQKRTRLHWILLDTNVAESNRRIASREGHFYETENEQTTDATTTATDDNAEETKSKECGSEWVFAPVTFDHLVLDGLARAEENAASIVAHMRERLVNFDVIS